MVEGKILLPSTDAFIAESRGIRLELPGHTGLRKA
jgi:hypothetical protein